MGSRLLKGSSSTNASKGKKGAKGNGKTKNSKGKGKTMKGKGNDVGGGTPWDNYNGKYCYIPYLTKLASFKSKIPDCSPRNQLELMIQQELRDVINRYYTLCEINSYVNCGTTNTNERSLQSSSTSLFSITVVTQATIPDDVFQTLALVITKKFVSSICETCDVIRSNEQFPTPTPVIPVPLPQAPVPKPKAHVLVPKKPEAPAPKQPFPTPKPAVPVPRQQPFVLSPYRPEASAPKQPSPTPKPAVPVPRQQPFVLSPYRPEASAPKQPSPTTKPTVPVPRQQPFVLSPYRPEASAPMKPSPTSKPFIPAPIPDALAPKPVMSAPMKPYLAPKADIPVPRPKVPAPKQETSALKQQINSQAPAISLPAHLSNPIENFPSPTFPLSRPSRHAPKHQIPTLTAPGLIRPDAPKSINPNFKQNFSVPTSAIKASVLMPKLSTNTVPEPFKTAAPVLKAKVPAPRPLPVLNARQKYPPKSTSPITVTLQKNLPFSIQLTPYVKSFPPMAVPKPVSKLTFKALQPMASTMTSLPSSFSPNMLTTSPRQLSSNLVSAVSPHNPTVQDPQFVSAYIPMLSSPPSKPSHTMKTPDTSQLLVSVVPSSSIPLTISLPSNVQFSNPQIGKISQSLSNASPGYSTRDQSASRNSPTSILEFSLPPPTNLLPANAEIAHPLLSPVPSLLLLAMPTPAKVNVLHSLAETEHPLPRPTNVVTSPVPEKSLVPIPDPRDASPVLMKSWAQRLNPQPRSPEIFMPLTKRPKVPIPTQSVGNQPFSLPHPSVTNSVKITTAPLTHSRQRKHGWIGHKSEEPKVDIVDKSNFTPTSTLSSSPIQPQFVTQDSNTNTSQNTNRSFLPNSNQLVGGVTMIMLATGIILWISIICCCHLCRREQQKRIQRQYSSIGSL